MTMETKSAISFELDHSALIPPIVEDLTKDAQLYSAIRKEAQLACRDHGALNLEQANRHFDDITHANDCSMGNPLREAVTTIIDGYLGQKAPSLILDTTSLGLTNLGSVEPRTITLILMRREIMFEKVLTSLGEVFGFAPQHDRTHHNKAFWDDNDAKTLVAEHTGITETDMKERLWELAESVMELFAYLDALYKNMSVGAADEWKRQWQANARMSRVTQVRRHRKNPQSNDAPEA